MLVGSFWTVGELAFPSRPEVHGSLPHHSITIIPVNSLFLLHYDGAPPTGFVGSQCFLNRHKFAISLEHSTILGAVTVITQEMSPQNPAMARKNPKQESKTGLCPCPQRLTAGLLFGRQAGWRTS